MPTNQQYDILIDGRGFMLARGRNKGRSWRRTSVASIPGGSSPDEARYGTTAPNMRFKEVVDDFSGGDGYAYRAVAPPNGIHWSENMDCRWPGQAVHCQAMVNATLPDVDGSVDSGVSHLIDIPLLTPTPAGHGGVFAFGRNLSVAGNSDAVVFMPQANAFPPRIDASPAGAAGINSHEGPAAIFGSFLYVGGASGNFHRYTLDGLTATLGPSGASGPYLHGGMLNAGNRLWSTVGPPSRKAGLRSIAAGTTGMAEADWSATLPVGNGRGPIQALTSLGGQVFAGLPDGLYAGDQSGSFLNVTGQVGQNVNADNFRDLCVHQGEVIGQHVGGIFAHNPTTTAAARTREIGPSVRSSRSPVRGIPLSVVSFGGWLYAGLWTGSQSYVKAGREEAPGAWRWHTLQRVPHDGRVGRLYVDGVTYASGNPPRSIPNRMWAAMQGSGGLMITSGSAPLLVCPLPRLNGNPLAPDPTFSANYAGSARFVLPAVDRGAPGVTKIGEAVEVWADGFLSGSRYADVYYAADRGPRTLLGRAQTSPVSTLLMGSTNGSFPVWRSLEIDIESFNTTPGTCQVYRSVVLTGNLRPDYVETIEALVTIADDTPDRRGTPMRPGAVQIDELRDFAHPLRHGTVPHQLTDLAGATSYVVFDGMPVESESYQEGSENPELLAQVTMVVLTLSQNTQ